jgi:hypothetical protein
MGAWGTRIFSDDEALDIRGDFRDMVGLGESPATATSKLMKEWSIGTRPPSVADYEFVVWGRFWMFLAAAKWEVGRLDKANRDRALKFIREGGDVEDYTTRKAQAKRAEVLEQFAAKLESPQPEKVDVPKPKVFRTNWKVGTVFAYRLVSGNYALLRVIAFSTPKLDRYAIAEVIDWAGDSPAGAVPASLSRLLSKRGRSQYESVRDSTYSENVDRFKSEAAFQKWKDGLIAASMPFCSTIVLPTESERGFEADRWVLVGVTDGKAVAKPNGPRSCWDEIVLGRWKNLDGALGEDYGLR